MRVFDTIVAPITAVGGAVAWVRVSGPDAFPIAQALMAAFPADPVHHKAIYGSLCTGDSGLALPFVAPGGFTGEDAVEISLHGSRASVNALVDAACRAGARLAQPGEFSLRAFLRGKIDLAQAEAIRDTVAAETQRQLMMANRQRRGELTKAVQDIRNRVIALLAALEASIDFEEEVGPYDHTQTSEQLRETLAATSLLEETADAGRILREGLVIALVGLPNVGKSSLLNRLAGYDRAIVTPEPGTTRDTVEVRCELAGIPTLIIDTAGLRTTTQRAEAEGIKRSLMAAETADAVWLVHDYGAPEPPPDVRHDLIIANKSDLGAPAPPEAVPVSALTGAGISQLLAWIERRFSLTTTEPLIDPRHAPLLQAARQSLEQALHAVTHALPPDLIVVHLRAAIDALGQVTGETASADMVDRIFQDFCIGK